MKEKARHLITTADERSWNFDGPVLFLGEWCRLYDRKALWHSMDEEVALPFILEAEQGVNNIDYLQALVSKMLTEVSSSLNAFHTTNHSSRYWNILLGHWLMRHVNVCYNRYFTIEQALKSYHISSTTELCFANFNLATPNSSSFIKACDNDVWNHVLSNRILKYMECKDILVDLIYIDNEEGLTQVKNAVPSLRKKIRDLTVKGVFNYFLPKFCKSTGAFIIGTYMPKLLDIKLHFALGQCPQFWQTPPLIPVSVDLKSREKFTISSDNYVGFEKFVRDLLPEMIPTCYLEGYVQLNRQIESLSWPSKPSFIFTSNNFDTDEIFKAWTGSKVEDGVPYFVAQHGNNYGTMQGILNMPELTAVDNFFSWGWTNRNTKIIPAFVLKTYNLDLKTRDNGGLLLLTLHVPPLVSPLRAGDEYFEFGIYQDQQFRFVAALPIEIQKELTVRLHDGWINSRWSDDKRWRDYDLSMTLDPGTRPVKNIIAKNRLAVHSYDSTGILEGLASNIPTLCFWNGGLDHLLPSAKPYYELLRGAGILADSPEHAAHLVSKYWANIDEWWESEQVQSARVIFCEQYARVEKFPIRTMKRLLNNAVLNHKIQTNDHA